jgi:NitT/TauT family transport system substrate-binding protein
MKNGLLKTGLRAALVALSLAAGSGGASAAPLLKVKMAIGGLTWVPYAAVVLAKQMGLFEKHGIDLELYNIQDGGATAQAVVTASADLGAGYFDHTTQITSKGRPVTAIVLETRLPGLAMFVTPKFDGKINSPQDLLGKQVGSSALGGLTSSRLMLSRYLRINKLDPDKIPVVLVGGPDTTLVAIEKGEAAAIVTGEPSITMSEQRSGKALPKLFDTRTLKGTLDFYGSEYNSAAIYGLSDWVEKHPDECQGVTDAVVESLHFITTHTPEEIVAKMPDDIKGTNKDLYLSVFKNMMEIFKPDGRFTEEGALVSLNAMIEAVPEIKQANVDVHKLYTNRFVDAAHKKLGF